MYEKLCLRWTTFLRLCSGKSLVLLCLSLQHQHNLILLSIPHTIYNDCWNLWLNNIWLFHTHLKTLFMMKKVSSCWKQTLKVYSIFINISDTSKVILTSCFIYLLHHGGRKKRFARQNANFLTISFIVNIIWVKQRSGKISCLHFLWSETTEIWCKSKCPPSYLMATDASCLVIVILVWTRFIF